MNSNRTGSLLQVATLAGLTVALTVGAAQAEPVLHAGRTESGGHATRRHHVRMAGELGAIFAIGNRWYWRDNGEPNRVDWQLPFSAGALKAKLASTEGWRFDGNPYDINALGHPGFGMLTHFLARQNGYGIGESFAISTLASGTWEIALEWAEYGSLNDMAVTSTAGVPLGESAYQILHHLRATHLDLHAGAGTQNGAAFTTVGFRADLDQLPTEGNGSFRAGQRVSFAAELPTDEFGVRAMGVEAKTTIAGTYHNDATSQRVTAVTSKFAYHKQADRAERAWDLLTSVGVGPSIAYKAHHGGLTIDVGAEVSVDFAMLKAQGFADWRAAHPTQVMRNVMDGRAQPYYFAVGATAEPRIQVDYRGFLASAKLTGRVFSSLDGADRDQEMISRTVHFSDYDTTAETRLGYARGNLAVAVDGSVHRRGGHADDTASSTSDRTAMVTVALSR